MNTTPDSAPTSWRARVLADALVVLPSVLRLFPKVVPWNVKPIGAMCLVGGARQPLWQALLTPLLVMAVTDFVLQRVEGWPGFDPFVYGAFVLITLLGRALRHSQSWLRVGAASLAASTIFFLVSNFGVWVQCLSGELTLYPPTAAGLLTCYVQGIPFYGLTLVGDLGFSFALLGLYDWVAKTAPAAKPVEEAAR